MRCSEFHCVNCIITINESEIMCKTSVGSGCFDLVKNPRLPHITSDVTSYITTKSFSQYIGVGIVGQTTIHSQALPVEVLEPSDMMRVKSVSVVDMLVTLTLSPCR